MSSLLHRLLRRSESKRCDAASASPAQPTNADASHIDRRGRDAVNSGLMRGLFSQLGEDATILWIFNGKKNGFYVDIGCHHPLIYSNTAALHHWHEWRGVNIDIDRRAIELFDEWRPNDINLVLGASSIEGEANAFIFDSGALSTLSQTCASAPHWSDVQRHVEKVAVLPLATILERYIPKDQTIDLLNVDAEGLDVEILRSNDWARFKPKAISVEVHDCDLANTHANPTFQLLTGHGYKLISHTVITSIYQLLV